MSRGISFVIRNEYGSVLKYMLAPLPVAAYNWYVGGEESYRVVENEMEPLFTREYFGMDGSTLQQIIEHPNVYLIFLGLKAFPFNSEIIDVRTYEEFLSSDCQFLLLIIDSVYVAMYCKDQILLADLYYNAMNLGYEKVQYITDDNDFRTKLSVW
ncbi:DUF2691 family protein [Paenibacillus sp. PR3]|uniref:DUF2691 family protein n=1 Tax=Paenibacillus terricola TaxID=2763503 RepID=A0ABR8MSJ9_9BACL|nr:DUF2691 family protein [Paenibacillus terricola]MBD3918947.1 DUF2691 family protein [Paenibacillus terricola]